MKPNQFYPSGTCNRLISLFKKERWKNRQGKNSSGKSLVGKKTGGEMT